MNQIISVSFIFVLIYSEIPVSFPESRSYHGNENLDDGATTPKHRANGRFRSYNSGRL